MKRHFTRVDYLLSIKVKTNADTVGEAWGNRLLVEA
jgi:hypothetical protein